MLIVSHNDSLSSLISALEEVDTFLQRVDLNTRCRQWNPAIFSYSESLLQPGVLKNEKHLNGSNYNDCSRGDSFQIPHKKKIYPVLKYDKCISRHLALVPTFIGDEKIYFLHHLRSSQLTLIASWCERLVVHGFNRSAGTRVFAKCIQGQFQDPWVRKLKWIFVIYLAKPILTSCRLSLECVLFG